MWRFRGVTAPAVALIASACSGKPPAASAAMVQGSHPPAVSSAHVEAVRRARVWTPTHIESMNIRAGARGAGSFRFLETVPCDYVDKPLRGHSLKFACEVG